MCRASPIHTYNTHLEQSTYSKRSRPSRLVVAQTLMTSLSLIRIPIVAAAASTDTPLHLATTVPHSDPCTKRTSRRSTGNAADTFLKIARRVRKEKEKKFVAQPATTTSTRYLPSFHATVQSRVESLARFVTHFFRDDAFTGITCRLKHPQLLPSACSIERIRTYLTEKYLCPSCPTLSTYLAHSLARALNNSHITGSRSNSTLPGRLCLS